MIKNYLTVTFRNFLRNKNYTLINILGLSVGVTSCIIIFLLITYELSFDKFHSSYDTIYRIVQESKNSTGISYGNTTPYPLANAFRNDFPDVPLVTQIHRQDDGMVRIDDRKFKVNNILFADSLFFEVFSFKVLSGNPRVELGKPGKVFITESLAKKISEGEFLPALKFENVLDLEVVGILEDPPATSHIDFKMIVSMPSLSSELTAGFPIDEWGMTMSGYTYLVLPENITPTSVEERLKSFVEKYYSKEDASRKTNKLQALRDIHFDQSQTENPGNAANADVSNLFITAVLGVFILVIACINFINLATAQAIRKSKEIGIRKTLGARRGQLTAYFLGETFLLTLFAVVISLCVVEWLQSWLNSFLQKQLHLNFFSNPTVALFLVVLIFSVTVLSGFYPAMVLSGFNPVAVLKNKITAAGSSGAYVRKVLVVFQFVIAQILVIGTFIIAGQMKHFRDKPLGFDKEAVITISLPERKTELQQSFRARLEANTNVQSVSFSLGAPTSNSSFTTNYFLTESNPEERYSISIKACDIHYLDTYGIKLKAGRWFSESDERHVPSDVPVREQQYVFVVNESAVKQLGFHDSNEIIGRHIRTGLNSEGEVIGVVEDFHVASLHDEIKPVVLLIFPNFYFNAGIKVNTANLSETLRYVEKSWTEVFPDYYFEYQFLDEYLATLYQQDQRTYTLFKIFAGVSIFIGCLGLYGLVSFMANQRLKEVGIRKIMGATATNIVMLFSKDFVRLIIIAFLIAAPLAWYAMDKWLQGFAYRIDIHWSVFAAGVTITLLIALLTVSYRSVRAAVSNPADTLRTE